jgi:hypothetical protein
VAWLIFKNLHFGRNFFGEFLWILFDRKLFGEFLVLRTKCKGAKSQGADRQGAELTNCRMFQPVK